MAVRWWFAALLVVLGMGCGETGSGEETADVTALPEIGGGDDAPGAEELPGCQPQCEGRACGNDGCGGSCGTCGAGESCAGGQCVAGCTPSCQSKTCGPDGCGGSCGPCNPPNTCNATGQCLPPGCTPDCAGKACGSDGCGGTCGACGGDETCSAGQCVVGGGIVCEDVNLPEDFTCTSGEDCQCVGCVEDGVCGLDDDCVCADCAADEVCADPAICEDDGVCSPFNESCSCVDCVGHAECGPCVPSCDGKDCGGDGCGGTCGTCGAEHVCAGGQCVEEGTLICSNGTAADDCTATGECACMGCADDGGCTIDDDCVCPECADDEYCGDPEICLDDGVCTPYDESCLCADCEAHPLCGCEPACDGKQCGDDGCGDVCGTCEDGDACVAGVCETPCESSCDGKSCGDDGCGGTCGECGFGTTCSEGDCGDLCPAEGEVPACTNQACVEANLLADGECDEALHCAEHGWDQGDCDPPGDTCAAAVAIEALPFTVTATTAGYSDDLSHAAGACPPEPGALGAGAPDVVYTLTPDEETDVLITLATADGFAGAVTVVIDCAAADATCAGGVQAGAGPLEVTLAAGVTAYVVVDGAGEGDEGEYTLSVAHAVPPAGVLVVNEVDYDQPSADGAEFLEILNAGDTSADLSRWQLEHVNGSTGTTVYVLELSEAGATLAPGAFLVVAVDAVLSTLPDGTLSMGAEQNFLQNGAPDGLRLLLDGAHADGVAWEGTMAGVGEGDTAPSDPGDGSLARCPDGADTGDNAADFLLVPTSTPGAPNACP